MREIYVSIYVILLPYGFYIYMYIYINIYILIYPIYICVYICVKHNCTQYIHFIELLMRTVYFP